MAEVHDTKLKESGLSGLSVKLGPANTQNGTLALALNESQIYKRFSKRSLTLIQLVYVGSIEVF